MRAGAPASWHGVQMALVRSGAAACPAVVERMRDNRWWCISDHLKQCSLRLFLVYHGKTDVRYLPALCVYRNSQFSSAEFACKLHTGTDLTGVECSRHASAQEGICSKGIWFYWRNHAAFVQNVDKILDLQSIEKSFLTLRQLR